MPTQKDIEREAARTRSAKPSAWVTGYERDRYVDEKHIDVTTTIGDLAGSHGAAYRALKEAGITPSRTSAGSIRLTVDEDLSLSRAKALVAAALKSAGIKVHEEFSATPSGRSHSTVDKPVRRRAHATRTDGGVDQFWGFFEDELANSAAKNPGDYALGPDEPPEVYARRVRDKFQSGAEASGLGHINLGTPTWKRVARRLGIAKFSQKALKEAYASHGGKI